MAKVRALLLCLVVCAFAGCSAEPETLPDLGVDSGVIDTGDASVDAGPDDTLADVADTSDTDNAEDAEEDPARDVDVADTGDADVETSEDADADALDVDTSVDADAGADADADAEDADAGCSDEDLDGVCDDSDLCPGADDRVDSDADGIADGCDMCPGFDDSVDADGDRVPDGCDVCPAGDDSLDSDADTVPDACDACLGGDDLTDTDGDGVPNFCDECPAFDDAADTDSDGVADACDPCPFDAPDDSDEDGVCESDDQCAGEDDRADRDSDGVADCLDECPDDPDKVVEGGCGCGVSDADSDSDGTLNCEDECPLDPAKVEAGDCGCGLPDTDSDSDGSADCIDFCPADPAKTAPGLCGCGLSDADSDADGTPDCSDACPTDPGKLLPGTCGCGTPDLDSDGDEALDCIDRCPADPDKVFPGVCGCGLPDVDSDSDGAADCIDSCPDDPAKTSPGACGCGAVEVDSDGDGIPDCVDGCPADPDKSEAGACGCGTPDIDSDGDSVVDCEDACPADSGKVEPGVCGCGVADADTDGDSVVDCIDGCPLDGGKLEPGVCGCGVADADSDADGALDCLDECALDPDKFEPGVCGCGVSDADSDGDGAVDCVDLCPGDGTKTEPGVCGCDVPDVDSDGDGALDCDDVCPGGDDTVDGDGDGVADHCDVCPLDSPDDSDADGICGVRPAVVTSAADVLSPSTARLGGELVSTGTSVEATVGVCVRSGSWATCASTSEDPCGDGFESHELAEATAAGTFEVPVEFSGSDDSYTFCAWASTRSGVGYGDPVELLLPTLPPEVQTDPVSGVTPLGATLRGTLVASNRAVLTGSGYCFGTAPNPDSSSGTCVAAGVPATGPLVATSVRTLEALTTYHVRAYVETDTERTYGLDVEFSTPTDSFVAQHTTLTSGFRHNCAILPSGTLKCWGANEFGQLGIGDRVPRGDNPGEMGSSLPAVDLGTGRTAVSVTAGERHTCALLDDGSVKCWGWNASGVLGQGESGSIGDGANEMGDNLPPVDLGTGRSALMIASGSVHMCAVLDDLTVRCWGDGGWGALGNEDPNDVGDEPDEMGDNLVAVDLGTGRTVRSLYAGGGMTCAILDDDALKCWGFNLSGGLGQGDRVNRGASPGDMGDALLPIDLGTGRTAQDVSVSQAVCAILDDDTLKCWGYNIHGQLGLGDTDRRGSAEGQMGDDLPVVDLGTGVHAVAIGGGSNHTCAVLQTGRIRCWGEQTFGATGYGGSARGDGPNEMGDNLPNLPISTLFDATAVYGGFMHGCAEAGTGEVRCWGWNSVGEAGQGTNTPYTGGILLPSMPNIRLE